MSAADSAVVGILNLVKSESQDKHGTPLARHHSLPVFGLLDLVGRGRTFVRGISATTVQKLREQKREFYLLIN